MTKEFYYYAVSDMSKYIGQWVAILDNKVVSSGTSLKEVYTKALEIANGREPLFARVPEEEETLIL